ncbi:MAG: DUF4230 domain-containing protein [Candidatus Magasanikbacteria bacterium]|nr:DUF4230 domain-containing protein [Candidatus Magasanikbacteria bacterium]
MRKYFILGGLVIVFALGLYLGNVIWSPKESQEVITKQTIVTGLKNEGFLVSQSFILNQEVNIDKSTGSAWKDIFWGQDITARGIVEVGAGVDLAKLTEDDVEVTEEKITIKLPHTEINSVEIKNGIQMENNQGVLKRVFDNDDGYNEAYEKIRTSAIESVETEEFKRATEDNARQIVERLIKFIEKDREILVKFK